MESDERPAKFRKVGHHTTHEPITLKELGTANASELSSTAPETSSNADVTNSTTILGPAEESAVNGDHNGSPDEAEASGQAPTLSKNQQKKLRKRQEWLAKRPDRIVQRKERRQRKKERNRTALANGEATRVEQHPRNSGAQVPVTIVFDCGFDDKMTDKEIVSLSSQITRSYAENKKAKFKCHIAVSSWGGKLKERFETVLEGHFKGWNGIRFSEQDFEDTSRLAQTWMSGKDGGIIGGALGSSPHSESNQNEAEGRGEVIYLSSDSDYTLTKLQPYSTYIIGGLVDRNRHKGLCHKTALDKGIKTAKLPIGEYIQMASRQVLTTNQVLEIMLRWLELGDWGAAFMAVIPKRKGGVLKETNVEKEDNGNDDAAELAEESDECIKRPSPSPDPSG